AALGLLWVKRTAPAIAREYVIKTFDRYWREELNLEDETVIDSLMTEIHVTTSGFKNFAHAEGRQQLDREQTQMRDAGVFDVPAYLLNGDVFIGRQHLALIRQLLRP